MSGHVTAVLEQAKRLTADERAELLAALLRLDSDRSKLDGEFARLWADPARNAAEAEFGRRIGPEIRVKTLTRALDALLEEGAIEATGDRRWRTYRLRSVKGIGPPAR